MNNKLILVTIDKNYCNYLRTFDTKVPYNFKEKELRPFIGVLFKINSCMYFAPLSSPKPKHLKLKAKLDLLKIDYGKLGVINFNNMIPVKMDNVSIIDLNYKTNNFTKKKYLILLNKQIYWLNRNSSKIFNRSKILYSKYMNGTLNYKIMARCCNFKLLEEKCDEYEKNKSLIT